MGRYQRDWGLIERWARGPGKYETMFIVDA